MTTSLWTTEQRVAVSILHVLAIVAGTFRSSYQWCIFRFRWEDVWATMALLLDVVALVCVWMPSNAQAEVATLWMEGIALTSGLWAARMSMITSIMRITHHHITFRRSACATAILFSIMWLGILAEKLYDCVTRYCYLKSDAATVQLVTDIISDALLIILPPCFLRGINITRGQRVLLISSFAASICITISSITHTIFLFLPYTATVITLAHVKTALAVIICNLLFITTFIYRLCHREDVDPEDTPRKSDGAEFTSIIPPQWTLSTSAPRSTTLSRLSSHPTTSAPNVDTPRG